MLNLKTLIAAAMLSSIAAVSFAQAPAMPKDAGAAPVAVTSPASAKKAKHAVKKSAKKHASKKAHKASASKAKSADKAPAQ